MTSSDSRRKTDRDNFARFLIGELGGRSVGRRLDRGRGPPGSRRDFPIGIDAERFARFAVTTEARRRFNQIRDELADRKQIIGVDRLDYSKGIPERLRAFERLLKDYPENRGQVSLLQVAPLSREKVRAYAGLRRELEELAGHINGMLRPDRLDPGQDLDARLLAQGPRRHLPRQPRRARSRRFATA